MNKRSHDLDADTCICGHLTDSHTCDRPNCIRLGQHTEHCRYPDCDCNDFLSLLDRWPSAKQANKHIRTDIVRHSSVDMNVRGVEMSDVRAAYQDRYGRKWFDDRPRWRSR